MLRFLPGPLKGALSFALIVMNTLFWALFFYPVAILKLLIPLRPWRTFTSRILDAIAVGWIGYNNLNWRLMHRIRWVAHGVEDLHRSGWYLVLSNHQSWADVLVLQKVFHRKIPFLRFFIKKELIWLPILGLAWWAMDLPFMKRYSKELLEKNPLLKGKNMETTMKSCEKFQAIPSAVMNFVEGTRFTLEKHEKEQSPYTHLLRPRAGGTAFVLAAMGEQFSNILDVTIVYPGGAKGLWQFLCGKVDEVIVHVEKIPVRPELIGDYEGDETFREWFREWINTLWAEKDRTISMLLAGQAGKGQGETDGKREGDKARRLDVC